MAQVWSHLKGCKGMTHIQCCHGFWNPHAWFLNSGWYWNHFSRCVRFPCQIVSLGSHLCISIELRIPEMATVWCYLGLAISVFILNEAVFIRKHLSWGANRFFQIELNSAIEGKQETNTGWREKNNFELERTAIILKNICEIAVLGNGCLAGSTFL